MARILILAGDGTASDHLDYAWLRMLEEGHAVTIAAPQARPLRTVVHQASAGEYIYTFERQAYPTPAHAAVADIDPAQFDGLLLPGGRAPEYLRLNPACLAIVRHFVDAAKPIAAICHGPLLLAAAGVSGRTMTCTDDSAPEIVDAGNRFVEAQGPSHGQPDHVIDGAIVTVRRRPFHHVWIREFLGLLAARGLHRPGALHPGKRIMIVAGDYTSGGQLLYALDRVREAGMEPVLVSPDRKRIETVIDMREEGADYDCERLGFWAYPDGTLAEARPEDCDGLLLPGWRAAEYLRTMPDCQRIVRHFVDGGKPIGAICQAARLLIAAGVSGRRMTGAKVISGEIAMRNTYVNAGGNAVIDGNIVTVSGRPFYHVWTRAFLDQFAKAEVTA
ncbi:MAG: DJ-1/PfpI family protein [Novosphingobium sp.]|jgi:protease I|nr:DJ-1/PfpI family protein [Novosphingobium sp.]